MDEKVKIGFPMEYEDDKHIIRTGLWLKEYEVEMLEKKLNEYNNLQSKIDKVNQYIKEAKESDSCTVLPSGKISDVGYCIDALEDIEDILKEDK